MQPDIEDILIKDCTNQELTPQEHLLLKDWLCKSAKNQWIHAQMKMACLSPGVQDTEKIRESVWAGLQKKINDDAGYAKKPAAFSGYWMKAAAVLFILVATGLIVYQVKTSGIFGGRETAETPLIWKESLPGQKITTYLPDGTLVKLNAESKISYPKTFNEGVREVTLSGEAFFEVVKDDAKPFVVKTRDIQAVVLGTSFNVKSYPKEELSEVAVASGRVAVENTGRRIEIEPGEKVSYQTASGSMAKEKFKWEEAYGWKDDILLFAGSSLSEVVERLRRWYGAAFVMEGNVPDESKRFSGRYKNPTLRAALEGLSYVYGFEYEIENETVFIRFK